MLRYAPPMGIYQTLYAFMDTFGTYMGEPGTHPWSQGFPRTVQLPGGPPLPESVRVPGEYLRYPKAWGLPALRDAIAGYYNRWYDAGIAPENVMVFAGGRPALVTTLLFLKDEHPVRIAETEYTPYYDLLEGLQRGYSLVASNAENGFRPSLDDYLDDSDGKPFVIMSNPCNPTGITRTGDELKRMVDAAAQRRAGVLVDEAYELFHDAPVSALQYVNDIDRSDLVVVGAATKGLQTPGIRIGWLIASRDNVEIMSNFSSFGMGGVSHPSQLFALELFGEDRVALARQAVPAFYDGQRRRYADAFRELGLELHSGDGGFYHWCRLTNGMTAAELNQRLFPQGAAVLMGTDCDMARRGDASPLRDFFRFSFGPLDPEDFEGDVEIMRKALAG